MQVTGGVFRFKTVFCKGFKRVFKKVGVVCLEMYFTDSIPYKKDSSKVKILSIAEMFADTIQRVYDNRSISSQYLI